MYKLIQSTDSRISLDNIKGILEVTTSHAVEDHGPGRARVQANKLRYKVQIALDQLSCPRHTT